MDKGLRCVALPVANMVDFDPETLEAKVRPNAPTVKTVLDRVF